MNVSFIIALYNCLPLTQAMWASLKATLPAGFEHEVIFVDDGSTDGTREWLASHPRDRVRVVLNDQNLGYAGANRRGVEASSGDQLVLLNNDVEFSRDWLTPVLDLLARPDAGLVGNVQTQYATGTLDHAGIRINAKGKPEHDRSPAGFFERVRDVTAVTGACLALSRIHWNAWGGFDTGYVNGGEDIDLAFRALEAGKTNRVALRSTLRHHISASPGRKRRDEENSRRLTLRWRHQLAAHGARAWAERYCADLNAAAAYSHPLTCLSLFAFATGLTHRCPPVAKAGIEAAIDQELLRWERLAGGCVPPAPE